jgi:predicted ATPase/DNA-binding CsgD family transcriptional regulator
LMRLYALSGRRHRALRQYEQLRDALRQELDTEPGAGSRRLYEEILTGHLPAAGMPDSVPSLVHQDARRHNLSGSLTGFVGRERERVKVRELLGGTRLLTLTGTGGCGKTRLAREVARDLSGAYPDGAWLVELAPLSEPELVPQAIAGVLEVGERPEESLTNTLIDSLREKKILLVLDNCEHLLDACAHLVETLLGSCPGLRILATSRETLGAAGEMVWQVPPLSRPDPRRSPTVEELEDYESVRLFVERARYRNPAFALTPQNAEAVGRICSRLDGIPLAIELAAARVGLSAEQIAARLDDSLRLLTTGFRTASPRQRTLRGALDWSHDLLTEPERTLFGRLSVFAGGFTLEAAEAVGAGDSIEEADVLDLLSRLVDKSLVMAEVTGDGGVRYRMLETVRQYAREKLEESGETDAVRRRHSGWCLAFAERAEARLQGPEQATWIEHLQREHLNTQAALVWSLKAEPETALRLVAALGLFWYRYGRILEGRRWLQAALDRTAGIETATRARALRLAGVLSEEIGLYEQAGTLHEEGLALYRRLGDRKGVAASLTSLGALAYAVGDLERGISFTEESLSLKRELGDERGLMSSRNNLGEMLQTAGDLTGAWALFEENLEANRRLRDGWGTALTLLNLGTLSVEQEAPLQAEEFLADALRAFLKLGDEDAAAECLGSLAGAAGKRGESARAATLLGAAEAAREELGTPIRPVEQERYERFAALSNRGLTGRDAWVAARDSGRDMSLRQAAEYALSPGTPPSGRTTSPLTRREQEIAALVSRGLTNRRIASELSISGRTVETHVGRILKKLGFDSRNELAARVNERR